MQTRGLFGDPLDDRASPVVQEEESNDAAPDERESGGETVQDEQGSGEADEQAAGEETEASEDLKVVVSIKGGRATIGVQQPSSDPHIETFDDLDVSGLTKEVPAMIGRAKAGWEDSPKHPAYVRPAPRPGAGTGAGRKRRRRRQPKPRRRRRRNSRRQGCSRPDPAVPLPGD